MYGLAINIIHSLCTCSVPQFSDDTKKVLRLALTEFSLPKFYRLFGISRLTVKSVAAAAFRISPRLSVPMGLSTAASSQHLCDSTRDDILALSDLEAISDALTELLEACNKDIEGRDLLTEWTVTARKFALRYNPALQPRALVVYGCLARNITENDFKQLLLLLVQAVKGHDDVHLISAIIMAMTRLEPLLSQDSPVHRVLFWIAIIVLQFEDAELYEVSCRRSDLLLSKAKFSVYGLQHSLAMLEQNLHTLESHNVFEYEKLERIMMDVSNSC